MTMIRSSSPAMSEISVGSPSPPPPHRPSLLIASKAPLQNGFHVMPAMKRLKTQMEAPPSRDFCLPLPQRRKSSNERVKSFSIADILGKTEDNADSRNTQTTPPPSAIPAVLAVPSILSSIPGTHAMPVSSVGPTAASLLMLELPSMHKVLPPSWGDPSRLATLSSSPSTSLPIHPFFPPALLHYEQRLAWDYQRQLQEHFHAQAQLMRQMSMDPNIILSEDGSERGGSRDSSSGGSQCCSPEVNVASSDEGGDDDVDRNDSTRLSHERLSNAETEGSTKSAFEKTNKNPNDTPLDALFQLSTKNFDEDQDPATLSIFATRPNPKKKRKSRTAFTNHQIFELEKRFLYQKYLSPADRDEIAAGLGLSNAQVITWFQNRRAKLKRDMEELKKDVESVKQLSAHKSFLENVNDLSILKTRPVSRHHQQPCQQPTEVIHSAALTHGSLGTSTGTASATTPAAGLSPSVRHQPITIQHPPPHQHQPHIITTNTCNEIRETQHSSNITTLTTSPASNSASEDSPPRSHSDSGQPAINRLMPQQSPQHQRHHHQPRNIQINNSRG